MPRVSASRGVPCNAASDRTSMMSGHETDEPHAQRPPPAAAGRPRRLKVSELLGGEREAILEHGGQDYRLRITANGKLILTK